MAEWNPILNQLSSLSTFIIGAACCVHLFLFFVLWLWSKRDERSIASTLFDFTKGLKHHSLLGGNVHMSDQIEAFIADVNDVLDDPGRRDDRKALLDRIRILDERRRFLHSISFETIYNMARTMIEAYPLAGVLGTILAIGAALQMDSAATGGGATSVGLILGRFGDAIWSTAAGLLAAMLLMFLNSCLEPPFGRLAESRRHVRDMVARVKRELAVSTSSDEEDE
ncbi:MAG: MotA/TolQ/ExbB proton channel family protein [Planctomycetaceae bacterium]|nr:MotA/TolQ/ExbB proton channel family protein [Planctomycetaceae bacterium]